ncbi:MAG: ATPase [Crocinitomicaceae bacterium]|nr:ATPase [Crocinitomicaceae bacterium]
MSIPFIYGKVAAPINFTNRKEELVHLKRNFIAQNNTILISPRRWGKTSLVQKASNEIMAENKQIKVCHLDIFNIQNEIEFYTKLADAVLKVTSNGWEEFAKSAKNFLSRMVPQISFSPDMQTELSFGLNLKEILKNPDDILDLAEKIAKAKKIKIVICIDEFQSIASFNKPLQIQKKLRAHWQHHSHVTYCLYGSKRHMLTDVFTNPSMPFYKFGDIILLEKIKTYDWVKFITKKFKDTHKTISAKEAQTIAELADNHPYYVQQLAQQVWFRTDKTCKEETIFQAHEAITDQLGLLFANMTERLSSYQVKLLHAIIKKEDQLSSQETMQKYNLGSSANVVRLKKTLYESEIINDYQGALHFLDPYYHHWLNTRFFI